MCYYFAKAIKQKQSLLAQAIHYFINETIVGRLASRFINKIQLKMKIYEFLKIFKVLIDWQYGYYYLNDQDLNDWLKQAEQGIKTIQEVVSLKEPVLEQLIDALAEIVNSWFPNKRFKKIKGSISKIVSISEAINRFQ